MGFQSEDKKPCLICTKWQCLYFIFIHFVPRFLFQVSCLREKVHCSCSLSPTFFFLLPDCETSVALERRWNQIKTMFINISKCKHPASLCAFTGHELQQIPESASLIRWRIYTSARWEELGAMTQLATLLGASCPYNLYNPCSMGPTPTCH